MRFKGDILITDPKYVMRTPYLTQDDWLASKSGKYMEILGLTNYFTESTLNGNWNCHTIETYDDPEEEVLKLSGEHGIVLGSYLSKRNVLGSFNSISGKMSVFSLSELRDVYNPDIELWCECHKDIATVIRDFEGEVIFIVGSEDDTHIVGKGNINFYTIEI